MRTNSKGEIMDNEIQEAEKHCFVKDLTKAFALNAAASAGAMVGVFGGAFLAGKLISRKNIEVKVAEESN